MSRIEVPAGRVVGLTRADAQGVLDRGDENLAVADLAGLGGFDDGIDRLADEHVGDDDFDLDFGQEAHGVFGAAIHFGMALLAAVAFDFRDGHALEADIGQI